MLNERKIPSSEGYPHGGVSKAETYLEEAPTSRKRRKTGHAFAVMGPIALHFYFS